MSINERKHIIKIINHKLEAATAEQLRSIFSFITHLIKK